jgi:hypothetical protein
LIELRGASRPPFTGREGARSSKTTRGIRGVTIRRNNARAQTHRQTLTLQYFAPDETLAVKNNRVFSSLGKWRVSPALAPYEEVMTTFQRVSNQKPCK